MDTSTRIAIENIRSHDRELQNQAFVALLAATDQRVDWTYEAWDELVGDLHHPDNHVRAIASHNYSAIWPKVTPKSGFLRILISF
jgi:hypothetical protein